MSENVAMSEKKDKEDDKKEICWFCGGKGHYYVSDGHGDCSWDLCLECFEPKRGK